jgi:hypothetical protein
LIHGAVAGGADIKVVYAPGQGKNEKPAEMDFAATESLDTAARLIQSENSNARQSGILCLRWLPLEKNRKDIVLNLTKGIQDSACGVRGASAWVAGNLHLKELRSPIASAVKGEKDSDVKKTMEKALETTK